MSNTQMSLNAELYRQLGYIADDKSSMEQILDYVKGIVAKYNANKSEAAYEKAAALSNIKESFMEYKDYLDGKDVKLVSEEEFEDELRREGYYD